MEFTFKWCWCQMATLRMKVKNSSSAKNVVVRRLTEQSAIVKPVIILYEQAEILYKELLYSSTELCEI